MVDSVSVVDGGASGQAKSAVLATHFLVISPNFPRHDANLRDPAGREEGTVLKVLHVAAIAALDLVLRGQAKFALFPAPSLVIFPGFARHNANLRDPAGRVEGAVLEVLHVAAIAALDLVLGRQSQLALFCAQARINLPGFARHDA